MNACDPNTMIGDVQLMAMASWMDHEEKRATEVRSIIGKELSEPLMITKEPDDPLVVISAHQHLANIPIHQGHVNRVEATRLVNPLPKLRRGIVLGFPLFQVTGGQAKQSIAAYTSKNFFPVSVHMV